LNEKGIEMMKKYSPLAKLVLSKSKGGETGGFETLEVRIKLISDSCFKNTCSQAEI
jgi:hypothetical protein|tara:strand:+ start:232 stop:399 length:168 start_codon:yes stop_codon:yes gene_type:complete